MSAGEEDDVRGAANEENPSIDETHLEAILKDQRLKAALLTKLGLGGTDKDQHPTPRGTNTGAWPSYPLGPLGWPGFFPPFP